MKRERGWSADILSACFSHSLAKALRLWAILFVFGGLKAYVSAPDSIGRWSKKKACGQDVRGPVALPYPRLGVAVLGNGCMISRFGNGI
jgi:hypothetical protein